MLGQIPNLNLTLLGEVGQVDCLSDCVEVKIRNLWCQMLTFADSKHMLYYSFRALVNALFGSLSKVTSLMGLGMDTRRRRTTSRPTSTLYEHSASRSRYATLPLYGRVQPLATVGRLTCFNGGRARNMWIG